MTASLPTREYAAAGGVVVELGAERVLVLTRPGRLGPEGLPEVRLPKGHVEPGECPPEAALREVAEESGLSQLEIVADLGHQTVEFDWRREHHIREEIYFLMACPGSNGAGRPEAQFRPLWLTWKEALQQLTYEAEREWVRRARRRWQELGRASST